MKSAYGIHGYLYLIECEPSLAKVGFSTDPDRRLKSVFSTAPDNADSMWARVAATKPATMADEIKVHNRLKFHRVNGLREWYEDSPDFRQALRDSGFPVPDYRSITRHWRDAHDAAIAAAAKATFACEWLKYRRAALEHIARQYAPSARIKAGIARAKAQGKAIGRPKRVFNRDQIREMRAAGKSYGQIQKATGVPVTTIRRTCEQ